MPHAFFWQKGKLRDLGTLRGLRRSLRSEAAAISSSGQVVGWSDTDASGRHSHAVLWTTGKVRDLGALPDWSHANAINSRGQIVGESGPEHAFRSRAFIWESGAMSRLGGDNGEAFAINDAGQILGTYVSPDVEIHAVLWTKR